MISVPDTQPQLSEALSDSQAENRPLFVEDLPLDESDIAIVTAIIHLAHAMKMRVIAEGVETAGQRDLLLELGCDEVQGYLYSAALPPEQIGAMLTPA
jgi:EAL domain-containing protein (putative c-di-GMP-specific phosphodiesterase class I)